MTLPDEAKYEHGPRLKLERATQHLHALNAESENVRARPDLYSFIVEYDPNDGTYIIGYRRLTDAQARRFAVRFQAILEPFAPLIGDFAHNARGALDLITWRLARRKLGREPTNDEARNIQFPILQNPAAFASAPVLKFIDTDPAQEIESFQPYHALNPAQHPFARLHWLSNHDKHRLLTPTLSETAIKDLPLEVVGGEAQIHFFNNPGTSDRMHERHFELTRVRLQVVSGEPKLRLKQQPPMRVIFSGPTDTLNEDDLRAILDLSRIAVEKLNRFL
jgi:hypothetical protein